MKKRRNDSSHASTLQVAFSTGLISISAILVAMAVPINTEKAPQEDLRGFQLKGSADLLGNYPDTSMPLSTDTTVTPDATPTNTTSINVSISTNFTGTLVGNPTTGVVRVTDAHPAGTYTVTVTAFDGAGLTTTKTFTLTVTTPATCPEVNFAAPGNFGVSYDPRSVAVGDFNGDGKQDLATANQFNVSILLGDGTGYFSAATHFTTGSSYSVAVGDFNGDGKQDLATANYQNLSILLGDGAGQFSASRYFSAGGGLVSVAVGDFNGDGKQDLAAAKTDSSAGVAILLGDGAGNLSVATYFVPAGSFSSIALGDFNADGDQDLAVAGEGVSILLGDGSGYFSTTTNFGAGDEPSSVRVGDFNADGRQDLAVANHYSANVSVLLGDGMGLFSASTNFVAGGGPRSVAVGDFNGDGKQDLAFANDVTNNASILLGDGAGLFSGPIYFPVGMSGGNPSSVAVGDFNGDGKQDLAVSSANYASHIVSILLRDCAATTPTPTPTPSGTPATCPVNFAAPRNFGVGQYPTSVAVGDFNSDGKQDLATANEFSNNVSILLGDGAGHFGVAFNFFADDGPKSIVVGDFNGNGNEDLAVANYFSGTVSILLGDGAGGFSPATNFDAGSYSTSVAVGDFNTDGRQDVAVARGTAGTVAILLGDGTGYFSAPTQIAVGGYPASIVKNDFNGDGNEDLAVANADSDNVSILLGDGAGGFSPATNFAAGSDPYSVTAGDFNGDGNQDLAVAHYDSPNVSLLLGNGTGLFGAATNFGAGDSALSVAVGEFNGDGKQDLAVANYESPNVSILLGDGAGGFSAPINFVAGSGPNSLAVGDFNGDGMPDLAVANNTSNNVSILLRDCSPRPTPTLAHFAVSAPQYAFGGFPFYLSVAAKDQFNTTVTGYPGTVHFTASGPAYLPPDSPLPNGMATFMSTLNSLGYQTITVSDTVNPSITGTSNPVFVRPEGPPPPSPTPSPTPTATPTATATGTPAPTPPTTPTPIPCVITSLREDFDTAIAPALPAGWHTSSVPGPASCAPGGICPLVTNWLTISTSPRSSPNCAFHDAPGCVTDSALDTFSFQGLSGSFLQFYHNYNLESGFDGGVLEISINSGPFIDFIDAGGAFILGGYNGTIATGVQSPIEGRQAWTGQSGGYVGVAARLPAAAWSQNVTLRFRLATDCIRSSVGWRIDDVEVLFLVPCGTPTPTPSATPTTTPARSINLSTRLRVQTGDNVGIGGFIITGSAPKQVLLRGIGPSLGNLGVPDLLADPVLELHGPPGFVTIVNDNWRDSNCVLDVCVGCGLAPPNDLEATICATLDPGAYTAIIRGKNDTTGVALIEAYDLNQAVASRLGNISTRAFVSTGDNIVIAGFMLGGNSGDARIVVRGIGPSLTAVGVPDALANPTLELRDGNGALLVANNDWQDDPAQAVELAAAGLAPTNPLESGIAATLPPGPYTALLAGLNNGTGIGLVEVYDRGAP